MVLKVNNVLYSFPCCDDGTEILEEVLRREKEAGIRPDHDVDTYMKVRIFNLSKSSIFIAFLTVEIEQGLDSHILSYWLYDSLLGCQSVKFYILTVELLLCYHQAIALPGAAGSLAAEYTLKVRLQRSLKGLSYLSLVDLSMQVMKSHIRHTATPKQGDRCRCAQKWQVINQTHGYGLMHVSLGACVQMLGLDVCADTILGNEMRRGVSGGQRKRVTTGGQIKTNFLLSKQFFEALQKKCISS